MTFVIIDPAPVADDDINATELDIPVTGNVLTNDSDANPTDSLTVADPATETAAASPVTIATTAGGTVVINPDGTYEYTPATGFTGEDTFDYTVTVHSVKPIQPLFQLKCVILTDQLIKRIRVLTITLHRLLQMMYLHH